MGYMKRLARWAERRERKLKTLARCSGERILFIGESVAGAEDEKCPLRETCARYLFREDESRKKKRFAFDRLNNKCANYFEA